MNIFNQWNATQTPDPTLDIEPDLIPPPHAANDMEENVGTTGMLLYYPHQH